ncbi:MAG: zf-TFIIB domain-containing protein [Armatimonadetes bacterium]|nr:zf-TFIIB domain-containing protein [Armatimonadota bacterium]
MTERLCPDCHRALTMREFEGIQLDVCGACAGIWFDRLEFDELRKQGRRAAHQVEAAVWPAPNHARRSRPERWCPVCPRPLRRYPYEGTHVEVDGCPFCGGMWVQDAALEQMVLALTAPPSARLPGERPRQQIDADRLLAEATMEHERFMARAQAATAFFKAMGRRNGYRAWWGW